MSQFARKPRQPKPCANPIFEQWITEWKEEAEAKDSKMKYVYMKALKSLRKYPLPLASGKDCSILDGFGNHMCKMIENKMVKEDMIPHDSSTSGLLSVNDEDDRGRKPAAAGGSKRKKPAKADAAEPTSRPKQRKKAASKSHFAPEEVEVLSISDEEGCPPPPVASSPPPRPTANRNQGKRQKQYVPAFRSGGYALLMALHKSDSEPGYRGYMTKSELQREAQPYCDSSFDRADPKKNNHYTAWSSMAQLLAKDLVLKQGNPAQYFLTPSGRELAQKLASAEEKDAGGLPRSVEQSSEEDEGMQLNPSDQENDTDAETEVAFLASDFTLQPGNFEIVLYVDTCETNGRTKPQEVVNELQKNGVTVYVQKLSVGDFAWVCREIPGRAGNRNRLTMSASKELILPYIVERKRADDLAHSIRDGRYREQKHRLMQTKLNVIYLIESYGKGDWGLRDGALSQAVTNTQIVSGFQVQETDSLKDTCAYLTFMTRHIKTLYENKTLLGVHKAQYSKDATPPNSNETYLMFFNDFNDFAVKKTHWTTKEMFARHLLKMKGLSPDKAFAIVTRYPTLHDLMFAYSNCSTEAEKQSLLANLTYGTSGRRIGPSISRKVCRFYATTDWS